MLFGRVVTTIVLVRTADELQQEYHCNRRRHRHYKQRIRTLFINFARPIIGSISVLSVRSELHRALSLHHLLPTSSYILGSRPPSSLFFLVLFAVDLPFSFIIVFVSNEVKDFSSIEQRPQRLTLAPLVALTATAVEAHS